jgi:probable O-glycosylation ligase (exosortase A-associated)
MRDLIFVSIFLALLPVCFRRPLIGLLTFSWLAYMRPQDLCWGWVQNQRWSFLVAAVTVAGFLSRGSTKWFQADVRNWAMIALCAWVGVSLAVSPAYDPILLADYVEYVKVIGVALFTTAVVTRSEHLRVLLWVIALSFGFYGVKIGLAGVLTLGNLHVRQGPGGMLEDNNNFGLALTMALPLLVEMGKAERNPILRRGVFVMIPLTVITILLTHSRGALLSIVAMAAVIVWRSRHRLLGIGITVVGGLVAIALAPQTLIQRYATLADVQTDGSAMGRIAAWKTALNMSEANPIFGVGFGCFQWMYGRYASGADYEGRRVAHNAYLQILAECGAPALAFYLFLILSSFWALTRIRRDAKRLYHSSWIINYATMLEASLVAFVVGSTFLNRAQFDLFYHFIAIVVCFEVIARREMEGLTAAAPGARLRGGEIRVVRPRGFGPLPRPGGYGPAPGSPIPAGQASGFSGRPPQARGFRDAVAPDRSPDRGFDRPRPARRGFR